MPTLRPRLSTYFRQAKCSATYWYLPGDEQQRERARTSSRRTSSHDADDVLGRGRAGPRATYRRVVVPVLVIGCSSRPGTGLSVGAARERGEPALVR